MRLHPHRWPSVDLNNPLHRNAAAVFVFGTMLFLLLSSVGVYRAYQFTHSVGILRAGMPQGDGPGVFNLSRFSSCARKMRGLSI